MSIVLPILGFIAFAAMAIGGIIFAWKRGVMPLRIILEMVAVILGGIVALFPCACFALANDLYLLLGSARSGHSPASLDVVSVMVSAVGAVLALCLVSPPGGRGAWQAISVALFGFVAAAAASYGASFLTQNSWCDEWLLLLVPLSIASATVGSYALALGGH
jgi:hypothetical protein